jgi:YD repeat-containing protein
MALALFAAAGEITYHYTNGRLTGVTYDDGSVVQYTYDANGNRTGTLVTPPADVTPPSAPGNLIATATSATQVSLSWNASTDSGGSSLAGYKIERCQGSGCSSFAQIASTTSTSFPDSALSAGVTYRYRVRAYDGAGNHSGYSSVATATTADTVAPSVPTNLTAAAPTSSSVNLTWTGSTDNIGVSGYRIYRGGTQIGTTAGTNYTDTGVVGSTAYSYTVSAYDAAGNNSASSNTATVTTPDTIAPGVPTGLSASAASATQVNLTWNAVSDTGGSGLAGYRIYRGGVHIANRSVANYSDTSVSGSTAYSYTVAGYDNAGNTSAQSSAANVTTPAAADTTSPSVPANFVATASSQTQIGLTWSASTDNVGVTGYEIQRCAGSGCSNFSTITTTTATSYPNSGLSQNTMYRYRVRSFDAANNFSAYSAIASATTAADGTPPTVPGGLTANAASGTQVNLSWSASTDTGGSNLSGYKIERCQGSGCSSFAQIASTTSTSHSDSGLSSGATYLYRVRAYDGAGNHSGYSSTATAATPDTVAPSAPTGLAAAAPTSTSVNLTWTGSTDNVAVSGYRIYRGGTQIGTTSATNYTDNGVVGSTAYSYTVSAYDAAGNNSASSNSAAVTTPDTIAPGVPAGLSASAPSSTQVNLSWNAVSDTGGSGLAGYRVYRGGTQIGTTTGTSYSDTGVVGSTAYSYTVRAYDGAGNSSASSNTATVTTPDTIPPGVPTGLSASAPSSTQVNLAWNAVSDTGGSGLAGYRIYRGGSHIGTTTGTNYTDTGVVGSTAYSYVVSAYDGAGNTSGSSNTAAVTTPDTISPGVPTGLSASAASSTQVNLAWNAVSDTGGSGLAGYRIYRGGSHIANSSATSYSDTSVSASTAYSYTVAGYDNAGNTSAQSSPANATTPAPPDTTAPSVPSGVTTAVVGDNQVNISWSASTDTGGSGMAGYRIYRGGVQVGTSSTNSFADTTVSPFNSYSYTIAAYDGAGNVSGQSSAANAATFIQITNTSGNVLAGASALYVAQGACPNQTSCYWFVRKNYGDMASLVSVQHTSSPACNNTSGGVPVTGYQRVGCVLRAAPSKYGN